MTAMIQGMGREKQEYSVLGWLYTQEEVQLFENGSGFGLQLYIAKSRATTKKKKLKRSVIDRLNGITKKFQLEQQKV